MKGTPKAVNLSTQEEKLLSAAQAGQEWAFVELCYRHSSRILYTLYRITKNREDAEDAFQESVLRAFVHFGDFNRASSFVTWLTRIGVNAALTILRKRRVRPQISTDAQIERSAGPLQWEIADGRPSPEEYCIQHEKQRRLQLAISKLPPGCQRVVEIRLRSDSSMKEIAEKVGITIGATKSRLLRARKALHRSISSEQPRISLRGPV